MKKYENPSSFPNAIDPLIFFQDVDIPHKEVFDTFKSLIAQGRYTEATEYINSVPDVDGYFADLYNLIIRRIYTLQYRMKEADNKFIYSRSNVGKAYPFLHKDSIWFNYDKASKEVAPESYDTNVNEQIMDNMALRRVESITPNSQNNKRYDITATVSSNKLCYEDIYLTETLTLKEVFEDLVDSDPVWYTDRTFYRGEEIVEEYICDDIPKRTLVTKSGLKLKTKQGNVLTTKTLEEFDREPPSYCLATKQSPNPYILTKDGKRIKLYPFVETVSIIYIYSIKGKLLKKFTYPIKEPVLKTNPQTYPGTDENFIHTKFRIMANLPTLLWHRLSFITDYTDTFTADGTGVKDYLDEYKARVDTNIPRLIAPAPNLGIRTTVTSVTQLVSIYRSNMELLTDTIKTVTGEGEHLDENSLPKVVALFMENSLYSPIIAAALRLAERKGISHSNDFTMVNALRILAEVVNIPLCVTLDNGTVARLKTRDGKYLKLRYNAEV